MDRRRCDRREQILRARRRDEDRGRRRRRRRRPVRLDVHHAWVPVRDRPHPAEVGSGDRFATGVARGEAGWADLWRKSAPPAEDAVHRWEASERERRGAARRWGRGSEPAAWGPLGRPRPQDGSDAGDRCPDWRSPGRASAPAGRSAPRLERRGRLGPRSRSAPRLAVRAAPRQPAELEPPLAGAPVRRLPAEPPAASSQPPSSQRPSWPAWVAPRAVDRG